MKELLALLLILPIIQSTGKTEFDYIVSKIDNKIPEIGQEYYNYFGSRSSSLEESYQEVLDLTSLG